MSGQRTRLGLIGAGRWGRNYIKAIVADTAMQLCSVVSNNPATQSLIPTHCKVESDWRALLTADLDGVIIATPPNTHIDIGTAFSNAGIPLLMEKPLSCQPDQTLAFIDTVKSNHSIFLIDYIHLFNPYFAKLRSLCLSDPNPIQSIRSVSGAHGPFREDVPVLWDWGVHDLSMCLSLFPGSLPNINLVGIEHASTLDATQSNIRLTLDFENGCHAAVYFGNRMPEKMKLFEAVFADYTYQFNDLSPTKLTKLMHHTQEREHITIEQSKSPLAIVLSEFVQLIDGTPASIDTLEISRTINQLLVSLE